MTSLPPFPRLNSTWKVKEIQRSNSVYILLPKHISRTDEWQKKEWWKKCFQRPITANLSSWFITSSGRNQELGSVVSNKAYRGDYKRLTANKEWGRVVIRISQSLSGEISLSWHNQKNQNDRKKLTVCRKMMKILTIN